MKLFEVLIGSMIALFSMRSPFRFAFLNDQKECQEHICRSLQVNINAAESLMDSAVSPGRMGSTVCFVDTSVEWIPHLHLRHNQE